MLSVFTIYVTENIKVIFIVTIVGFVNIVISWASVLSSWCAAEPCTSNWRKTTIGYPPFM